MQRSMKGAMWIGSMALVALMAGASARAADPMPAATGHAKITVKVVDADGKPVSGVKVTVAVPAKKKKADDAGGATTQPAGAPTAPAATPMTGTTEADGTAVIKDVPDGSYAVRANLKGAGRGRGKVTVEDGKDEEVSITLAPAAPK